MCRRSSQMRRTYMPPSYRCTHQLTLPRFTHSLTSWPLKQLKRHKLITRILNEKEKNFALILHAVMNKILTCNPNVFYLYLSSNCNLSCFKICILSKYQKAGVHKRFVLFWCMNQPWKNWGCNSFSRLLSKQQNYISTDLGQMIML